MSSKGRHGGEEDAGHERGQRNIGLRIEFKIDPGRPEIKDHRSQVGSDPFFLCGQQDRLNETQSLHQQDGKGREEDGIQDGGE
ncbi:MAG: hypothetical protein IPI66_02700 [Chitinophagaceae bacterium]|nr:hypothetical protein [Chitinophagaceae bacterium]